MDGYGQRKLFNEILQHVADRCAAGEAPNVVLVTGDIAATGRADEYETFGAEFLRPLSAILGNDVENRILIVPGNHDVTRSLNKYFDREAICSNESHFFDPTEEGRAERGEILPRFRAYNASSRTHPHGWIVSAEGSYSVVHRWGRWTTGIVGLNTAWLCRGTDDRNNLTPGIEILDDAMRRVQHCDVTLVLGHHPLGWLRDDHLPAIRAILGKNRAIYLHGHLHKVRLSPEDGAGFGFLTLQAGAAFQTRYDEMWVNGFNWVELDLGRRTIRLQPRVWNPSHREWHVNEELPNSHRDNDWWEYALPDVSRIPSRTSSQFVLRGWQHVTQTYLDAQSDSSTDEQVLQFLDGAEPSWRTASRDNVAALSYVDDAIGHLVGGHDPGPVVVVLIGPTAEGKSMAILQTCAALARGGWQILWRVDYDESLNVDILLSLPRSDAKWLVAVDACANIARDVHRACARLLVDQRSDINFILASRDTDWAAAELGSLDWSDRSRFKTVTVAGLSMENARRIAQTWLHVDFAASARFGSDNVGAVAQLLVDSANFDSATHGGALLGALLRVRHGDRLSDHVRSLLSRLARRSIPGGMSLLDAFAYICAMHAEGLPIVSRVVLAEALGCPPDKLGPHVIARLGLEAAAGGGGQFLVARHRAIAQIATKILFTEFGIDIDSLYVELASAAKSARRKLPFVPALLQWEYDLPKHFFESGRQDLAIQIGHVLVRASSGDTHMIVNLAKMMREAGSSRDAAELMRANSNIGGAQRAWYLEWAVAEATSGNSRFGAYLCAVSIADQAHHVPLSNEHAKMALSAIGANFASLQDEYLDPTFRNARTAVGELGLRLRLDARAKSTFESYVGHPVSHASKCDEALTRMDAGVDVAASLSSTEIMSFGAHLPRPQTLTFNGLMRLVSHRTD